MAAPRGPRITSFLFPVWILWSFVLSFLRFLAFGSSRRKEVVLLGADDIDADSLDALATGLELARAQELVISERRRAETLDDLSREVDGQLKNVDELLSLLKRARDGAEAAQRLRKAQNAQRTQDQTVDERHPKPAANVPLVWDWTLPMQSQLELHQTRDEGLRKGRDYGALHLHSRNQPPRSQTSNSDNLGQAPVSAKRATGARQIGGTFASDGRSNSTRRRLSLITNLGANAPKYVIGTKVYDPLKLEWVDVPSMGMGSPPTHVMTRDGSPRGVNDNASTLLSCETTVVGKESAVAPEDIRNIADLPTEVNGMVFDAISRSWIGNDDDGDLFDDDDAPADDAAGDCESHFPSDVGLALSDAERMQFRVDASKVNEQRWHWAEGDCPVACGAIREMSTVHLVTVMNRLAKLESEAAKVQGQPYASPLAHENDADSVHNVRTAVSPGNVSALSAWREDDDSEEDDTWLAYSDGDVVGSICLGIPSSKAPLCAAVHSVKPTAASSSSLRTNEDIAVGTDNNKKDAQTTTPLDGGGVRACTSTGGTGVGAILGCIAVGTKGTRERVVKFADAFEGSDDDESWD